jgi:dihydroorotate dehydrogenase
LGHLGFGYVVGGTVTPRPAPGNPRPRLLRVPASHSLINSLGFPSDGLRAVEARLRRLTDPPTPVAVSVAALDIDGFEECHRALEPLVDAVELNVSSPNTQGLQRFHEPQELLQLLERINSHRHKPLFVKLPPYKDDQGRERVMAMLRQCLSAGVTGVTAINSFPVTEPRLAMGRGGLSGKVIFPEMLRVVSDLRREAGGSLVINACGGIATGEDAWRALQAGADTVQLFTALVYRGPLVVRSIAQDLVQRLGAQQADVSSAQRMADQRT